MLLSDLSFFGVRGFARMNLTVVDVAKAAVRKPQGAKEQSAVARAGYSQPDRFQQYFLSDGSLRCRRITLPKCRLSISCRVPSHPFKGTLPRPRPGSRFVAVAEYGSRRSRGGCYRLRSPLLIVGAIVTCCVVLFWVSDWRAHNTAAPGTCVLYFPNIRVSGAEQAVQQKDSHNFGLPSIYSSEST